MEPADTGRCPSVRHRRLSPSLANCEVCSAAGVTRSVLVLFRRANKSVQSRCRSSLLGLCDSSSSAQQTPPCDSSSSAQQTSPCDSSSSAQQTSPCDSSSSAQQTTPCDSSSSAQQTLPEIRRMAVQSQTATITDHFLHCR